jgi:hypothetical protein
MSTTYLMIAACLLLYMIELLCSGYFHEISLKEHAILAHSIIKSCDSIKK